MRRLFLIGGGLAVLLVVLGLVNLLLAPDRPVGDGFTLRPVAFSDIEGWEGDAVEEALPAFLLSCEALVRGEDDAPANAREQLGRDGPHTLSGTVGDWRDLCEAAARLEGASARVVRAFFEDAFQPVELRSAQNLFTGYWEPSYPASREPRPGLVPVLTRPDDLVTVELGAFKESLRGQDVVGRIDGRRLVPYPDHAALIEAPPDSAEALAYMDPDDLLFLQIQGSGRLVLPDGEVLRVGYAGKNGHAYVPIGRTLVRDGALALEDVTMQSIRAWLNAASPEEAARVRVSNPSYVFFAPLDLTDPSLGPLGAQGVQLTPGRSLAVDRRYHAMGAPVWVALEGEQDREFGRLMIAQDTGGAITGPVRGDVFFGPGEEAARKAGRLKARGRMIVLLPRDVAARALDAA